MRPGPLLDFTGAKTYEGPRRHLQKSDVKMCEYWGSRGAIDQLPNSNHAGGRL